MRVRMRRRGACVWRANTPKSCIHASTNLPSCGTSIAHLSTPLPSDALNVEHVKVIHSVAPSNTCMYVSFTCQVRRATRKAFAVLVSQGYRSLYQAVLDPPAGYDRATLARVLVHTPQQVDTLLEIATPFATPNHSPVSVNSVGSF